MVMRSRAVYITLLDMAKLRTYIKLTSVFHHFPSAGPKQLCALAPLGCCHEAGIS